MAGYIGPAPVPQATQNREAFTATSGQTSFATAGYTPQFIDVYLNGVKLAAADYTATNGSDVVLASGAASGDILEVVAFSAFTVADQAFTGTTTAANLTVTGAFTSQGIDDNANATAITIDSSENVGIGTSSPFDVLHVQGTIRGNVSDASDENIRLTTDGGGGFVVDVSDATVANPTWSIRTFSDEPLAFDIGGTERMRISSIGTLLVGTTTQQPASTSGVEGFSVYAGGQVQASKSGATAARFNRNSSDGDIVQFRKDGANVGSIGINGRLTIDGSSDGTGIYFGGSAWLPRDSGAIVDATVGLGGSTQRFTDLYLSGGVFLGGTGSANKLDDYESGTWTPAITAGSGGSSIVSGTNTATYTKIGRLVFCQIRTNCSSSSNSRLHISSLPFTNAGGNAQLGVMSKHGTNGGSFYALSAGEFAAYSYDGGNFSGVDASGVFRASFTYETTA